MDTELDQYEVFPWDKNFETGIEKIDEQHQMLVGILNKLANTLVDADTPELNKAFDALVDYANFHFKDEEAIWTKYFTDDPWLTSHQGSHTSFLPAINDIKRHDSHLGLSENIGDIMKFLIRWLAFHIIDNDQRMAIVVNEIESGASLQAAKKISNEKMTTSVRISLETIMNMYEGLAARTVNLMQERKARTEAENRLSTIMDQEARSGADQVK